MDISYCKNEYETAEKTDALIILTEWNQFRSLDLVRIKHIMNHPLLFDLRNIYEPSYAKNLGFEYHSVGRS